jgi:hypothetical protein
MAKKRAKALEGEVLPAVPENGHEASATAGAGGGPNKVHDGPQYPWLDRPAFLNVKAQRAVMAAANRAAVLLTENENATEVDYLCHMAIHRPVAFLSLFGKLIRQAPDAPTSEGGLVVNTTIVVGGKSLQ